MAADARVRTWSPVVLNDGGSSAGTDARRQSWDRTPWRRERRTEAGDEWLRPGGAAGRGRRTGACRHAAAGARGWRRTWTGARRRSRTRRGAGGGVAAGAWRERRTRTGTWSTEKNSAEVDGDVDADEAHGRARRKELKTSGREARKHAELEVAVVHAPEEPGDDRRRRTGRAQTGANGDELGGGGASDVELDADVQLEACAQAAGGRAR